jgi:hypothetical protein
LALELVDQRGDRVAGDQPRDEEVDGQRGPRGEQVERDPLQQELHFAAPSSYSQHAAQ